MNKRPSILENIYRQKKARVAAQKENVDLAVFVRDAARSRLRVRRKFRGAFTDRTRINIIAEIKRASPSRGIIMKNADLAELANSYETGGASALSVLTEKDNFQGSMADLVSVKAASSLPILRKDFIFEEFQIYESALKKVDAILLIAAMLDDMRIKVLSCLAKELGMDCLVEVHDEFEMGRALELGCDLIGVNNRNLHDFEVNLDTSRHLSKYAGDDVVLIAESGLRTHSELEELRLMGFAGFLIGEELMQAENQAEAVSRLRGNTEQRNQ